MRIIHKNKDDIRNENLVKKLSNENEKLQADLDYVAMMTDVDIPTEEEEHDL